MLNMFRKIYYQIFYLIKYRNKYDENSAWVVVIDTRSKRKIKRDEEKYNMFLEKSSKIITPNRKTIDELVTYLVNKYDAEKYQKSEKDYYIFLLNFLHSEYSCLFDDPILSNINIGDFISFCYWSNDESIKRVKYLLEKIENIDIKPMFYRIKEVNQTDDLSVSFVDIAIEEVTQYLSISGSTEDTRDIGRDTIIFFGVSEEDIEKKSIAFLRYACYLRDMGKIES